MRIITREQALRITQCWRWRQCRGVCGLVINQVVERYAEVGVSGIIMQTQGPWKREIYQRINDEVVAAFA